MASEAGDDLLERLRDLQQRLDEAEVTLNALRSGEVDALVASGPDGDRVYTLKGADEAYRLMVQEMAEGALTLTVEGLILFSNEQFASMLGMPLERMIGSSIHDFIAAEDASMLSALLTSPAGAKAEVRLKKAASTLVTVQMSANTLLLDGTECVCLVVTDLSEQRRSQEIVAAELFARSIFDQAAGAILVVDPAGRIIRASRAAEEMAGASSLLQTFDEIFRVWDEAASKRYTIEEILSTVRKQGSIAGLEATAQVPDGRKFDVIVNANRLTGAHSEYLGCVVLLSDVSGLKRAEEAAQQASEQRRMALEAASMGAWEYHLDSRMVSWDQRCAHIFGVPTVDRIEYDEVVSRIHPDDRAASSEALQQAIAGASGGTYDRECRVLWPDGSVHWVASHGRVYFEGAADRLRAVRFIGVSREVTERRDAEERLRQTQKLESIGLLAGGVAHDFNNLLTVIMGSASSALEECPSCEHSRAILSASERAANLTKQLLAYAGKGEAALKLVNLTDLVSDTTNLLSASVPKRVSLRFNLSKRLPSIEADPSRIEQILMNLVINSGESIPPKDDGWIEIATSRQVVTAEMARRHSKAYDVAAGDYVCLEVRDDGPGMDEATVSRVFDPFFSTKFTGRGLGLAAVHGIVRTSRGFIDVVSTPGAGTAFRVFLPASQKAHPTELAARTSPAPPRGSSTILVVDDEDMVRKLASMTLRRYGYEVLEAENGRHALQVIAQSPAVPSLVLLDLAMPVMGGDELVPILEQKYPALKVLISSGYPEEESRGGFPSPSVAGFLQKPYNARALVDKIAEALGGRSARS